MKIVLSVGVAGVEHWRDLELPSERAIGELLPALLQVCVGGAESADGWELLAAPQGGVLDLRQTLSESGVWEGSWLMLRPR